MGVPMIVQNLIVSIIDEVEKEAVAHLRTVEGNNISIEAVTPKFKVSINDLLVAIEHIEAFNGRTDNPTIEETEEASEPPPFHGTEYVLEMIAATPAKKSFREEYIEKLAARNK